MEKSASRDNYLTLCVHYWLVNDKTMYDRVCQIKKEVESEYGADTPLAPELAKKLMAYIAGMNPLNREKSLFADLLWTALEKVDWLTIAKSWLGETETEVAQVVR